MMTGGGSRCSDFSDLSVPVTSPAYYLLMRRICGNIFTVWAPNGNFYIIFSQSSSEQVTDISAGEGGHSGDRGDREDSNKSL